MQEFTKRYKDFSPYCGSHCGSLACFCKGKGITLAPTVYSISQLREVQQKNLTPKEKPNPQPLPCKGRGVRIKASLLVGERFGERSKCTASNREPLYFMQSRTAIEERV